MTWSCFGIRKGPVHQWRKHYDRWRKKRHAAALVIRMKFLIKDRPTLTCMIQARTPQRVFALIEKGLAGGADAFGLQLEQLERQYHREEIFTEFFSRMGNKPCYVTNYPDAMNRGLTDEALAEELLLVAKCGGGLLDIWGDMFCREKDQITYDPVAVEKQKALARDIHALGKEVLFSSHTYRFMEYADAYEIVSAQKARGADVCKIVTAAKSEYELKTNFEITAKLAKHLDAPCLFLCNGAHCRAHRKLAPLISNGMFLCVAEHDELSTATQPLLCDAKKIIELVRQTK